MKFVVIVAAGACLALGGCGDSNDDSPTQATTKTVQPKKKAAYCFFKREEMKGWTASRDKTGDITVKGKAHVGDARYQAQLGPPSVSGTKAEISPTIAPNTGYEAAGDWWDLKATIPNSAAVESVSVTCGDKSVAELSVTKKS